MSAWGLNPDMGASRLYSQHMATETDPHASTAPHRKIIHIDMDAFYASVEQRDNPELRAKPVAVGGSAERDVVAAASYEARKFGVRSAMPSVTAKRQCPDLLFVKARFEVYKTISRQIRDSSPSTRQSSSRRTAFARHLQPGRRSARTIPTASARQRSHTSTSRRPWQPTNAGKSSRSAARP